jgi:hypothetical protein
MITVRLTRRPDLPGLLAGTEADPAQFVADGVLPFSDVVAPAGRFSRIKLAGLTTGTVRPRARGGGYQRVDMQFEGVNYDCKQYPLEMGNDLRDISEESDYFDVDLAAAIVVTQNWLISREVRVLGQVFNLTNYPVGATTGYGATNKWDDPLNGTPIADAKRAHDAIELNLGGASADSVVLSKKTARNAMMTAEFRETLGLKYEPGRPILGDDQEIKAQLSQAWGVKNVYLAGGFQNTAQDPNNPVLARIAPVDQCFFFRQAKPLVANKMTGPGLGLTLACKRQNFAGRFTIFTYAEGNDSRVVRVDADLDENRMMPTAGFLLSALA